MKNIFYTLVAIGLLFSTTACAHHPYYDDRPYYSASSSASVTITQRHSRGGVTFSYREHPHHNYYRHHHRHYHSHREHHHIRKVTYYVRQHISLGPYDTYSTNRYFDRGWCVSQQITRVNRNQIRVEEWRTRPGHGCF